MHSESFSNDLQIKPALHRLIEKNFTILDRIFDDANFRDAFGITFQGLEITLQRGKEATLPALRRLIIELSTMSKGSRKLDDAAQRKEFSTRIVQHLQDAQGTPYKSSPTKTEETTGEQAKPETENPSSTASNPPASSAKPQQAKGKVENYPLRIFQEIDTDGFPRRIQRIITQTSKLNVRNNPDICAIMLRVILDLTCYQYIRTCAPNRSMPKALHTRVLDSLKLLEPSVGDKLGHVENTSPLARIYAETSDGQALTLTNYAVHSGDSTMTPVEIEILAHRYQPMLVAMNDKLRNNTDS